MMRRRRSSLLHPNGVMSTSAPSGEDLNAAVAWIEGLRRVQCRTERQREGDPGRLGGGLAPAQETCRLLGAEAVEEGRLQPALLTSCFLPGAESQEPAPRDIQ